ncbi:MAG: LuxR C-terminal-related transcriptional regulator [Cyanobacteria bacterium P01_F01_bin.3]
MSQSLPSATQIYSDQEVIHFDHQLSSQLMISHEQMNAADYITPREQEIVCLVAFGLSNKQIATRLNISVWTVSAHLRRVFNKLKVDTRAAVVYKCAPMIQAQAEDYPEAIGQFYS